MKMCKIDTKGVRFTKNAWLTKRVGLTQNVLRLILTVYKMQNFQNLKKVHDWQKSARLTQKEKIEGIRLTQNV